MNIVAYERIMNRPEIGFEHILVFKTTEEAIDERGEINKNSIKKRIQIVYTGKQGVLNKYQIFLFDTECIFHYALDPYNTLIRRLTYVFDECFIGVSDDGTIVKIFNIEFIQYRWKEIRSKLILDHEGDFFDSCISEMDDRVKSHTSILNYLQQTSMYGLYFNQYWNIDLSIKSIRVDKKEIIIGHENYLLKEDVSVSDISSPIADGVLIDVTSNSIDNKQIRINGKYQYINGILSNAKHVVEINSVKITQDVSWVGLRKRL